MSKLKIFRTIKLISSVLAIIIGYVPSSIAQTKSDPLASTLKNPTQPSQVVIPKPLQADATDLNSTDRSIAALQSLDQKYDCLANYPQLTEGDYRSDKLRQGQSFNRAEFAAGIDACANKINKLIATEQSGTVTAADLDTIKKLQQDFAAELATLKKRLDTTEDRTATLEKQQFSTTTKLTGEAVLNVAGASGANRLVAGSGNANIFANYRVRLNLTTSFAGGSTLIAGLQSTNSGSGSTIQSTLGYNDPGGLNSSTVRLGSEVQFPANPNSGTTLAGLTPTASGSVNLYKLLYLQPVNKNLIAFVGTNAEVTDAFPQISPLFNDAQGSVSRFGTAAAITRLSGGTSGFGLASAGGLIWLPTTEWDVRALYGSINASVPGTSVVGGGLFGGSTVLASQVTYKPSSNLAVAFNYAHSSHAINILGTGLSSQDIIAIPNTVNALSPGIVLDSVGLTVNSGITPQIDLTATGSLFFANLPGIDARATFSSWMTGVSVKDVLGTGNRLGVLFGQPLNRSGLSGSQSGVNNVTATPYQLETFFNFRVSDNISITPGVFFVFSPEGIAGSPTATVGVVRTSLTF